MGASEDSFDNVSVATETEYSSFTQESGEEDRFSESPASPLESNLPAPPIATESRAPREAKMCRFGSECFSKRCRFAHPSSDGVPRLNSNRTPLAPRPCKH